MPDRLAALHNPHDGRLSLIMPVGRNALVRLFVFFPGLFELDLIDFDAIFGIRKGVIDGEGVVLANVSALGCLA